MPRNQPSCPRCAQALVTPNAPCLFCQKSPWRIKYCLSPFIYQKPIIQLVADFKYREKLAVGRSLSLLLAQHIMARYSINQLPEIIMPMPLHNSKLRERGFNQSLEIARTLSIALKIPIKTNLSKRLHPTESQVGKNISARNSNVYRAFSYQATHPYKSIAIVDDVLTTGASARSLANAMPKNIQLHLWCLARTL